MFLLCFIIELFDLFTCVWHYFCLSDTPMGAGKANLYIHIYIYIYIYIYRRLGGVSPSLACGANGCKAWG